MLLGGSRIAFWRSSRIAKLHAAAVCYLFAKPLPSILFYKMQLQKITIKIFLFHFKLKKSYFEIVWVL